MSTNPLLPVLREKGAPMTLCSICPTPGACCKGFVLSHIPTGKDESGRQPLLFWRSTWRKDAAAWLADRGLDFIPSKIAETYREEESGKPYVSVRFNCSHLTTGGRCGIYETRPNVCRQYLPTFSAGQFPLRSHLLCRPLIELGGGPARRHSSGSRGT